MFLAGRPSGSDVAAFLAESQTLKLSYSDIGMAGPGQPSAFRIDEHRVVLGLGAATFDRAKRALTEWRHFDLGWLELHPPDAGTEVATVVAVLIRHLGFWSLNGCRVVYRAEREHEQSFAYGTLSNHAECGEEWFAVSMDPRTGEVTYTIRAASRPRALLAWFGYPVTRALQARFRRDSAAAMLRHVTRSP